MPNTTIHESAWRGGDFDYDRKGHGYVSYRQADPRIAAYVHRALGEAKTVLNIGAGSGNYEPDDRYVIALEPSPTMRAQRPPGRVPALHGFAESIPLDDRSVDASMAMLTVHQWQDMKKGIDELIRVTRGPIVILTFDPETLHKLWLFHYVPEFHGADRKRFAAIPEICEMLGGRSEVTPIPIPIDCFDGFTEAFYGRPEAFLDPAVRRAQSAWAFVEPDVEERFVRSLEADIQTGEWDRRFGNLRQEPFFHGALRLIVRTHV